MSVRYIDAHCHVQFEQYAHDRDDIIARMREEGVAGIVVGVDVESSKKAVVLAGKIRASVRFSRLAPESCRIFW